MENKINSLIGITISTDNYFKEDTEEEWKKEESFCIHVETGDFDYAHNFSYSDREKVLPVYINPVDFLAMQAISDNGVLTLFEESMDDLEKFNLSLVKKITDSAIRYFQRSHELNFLLGFNFWAEQDPMNGDFEGGYDFVGIVNTNKLVLKEDD